MFLCPEWHLISAGVPRNILLKGLDRGPLPYLDLKCFTSKGKERERRGREEEWHGMEREGRGKGRRRMNTINFLGYETRPLH